MSIGIGICGESKTGIRRNECKYQTARRHGWGVVRAWWYPEEIPTKCVEGQGP